MTKTETSSPQADDDLSFERLRSLLSPADVSDEELRRVAPLLNSPDEHLPPARFRLEPANWKFALATPELESGQLTASRYGEYWLEADLALRPEPLQKWEQEREDALQREAVRVLREKDERLRKRWEENAHVLDVMREGIAQAKETWGNYPGRGEAGNAEERQRGLIALEKRTLRVRKDYGFRVEVLRQVEDRRAHTGGLRELSSRETKGEAGAGRNTVFNDPSTHPAETLNAVLEWTADDAHMSRPFRGKNSLCGFVSERLKDLVGYEVPQATIRTRLESIMNSLNVDLPHGPTNKLSYFEKRGEIREAMKERGLPG